MQQDEKRVPLRKGTLIGEFVIEKAIGYGGSSICYSAISKDRKVIIKEVYPKSIEAYLVRNPKNQNLEFLNRTLKMSFESEYRVAVDRQKREKEIANTLRDPYDENNSYFFACYSMVCEENGMEYLIIDTEGGQMLQEILAQRNEPGLITGFEAVDDVIEITKRIIEAVVPIHRLNKIHCDLSPDNIFVSYARQDNKNGRRNIKAIDFNSTFTLGENINDFSFSKKEGYSPIELMVKRMNWQIGFGTDIYSIASILFNMLYNELFIYEKFTDDGFEDKLLIGKESAYLAQLNLPARHKLQKLLEKALVRRNAADSDAAAQAMLNDLNEIQHIQKNAAGYSKERFWNMSNSIFTNTFKRLHGNEIINSIMPELNLSGNDMEKISLQNGVEMLAKYPHNNHYFIFAEKGGAGKTTHLMLMWKFFIDNYNVKGLVPLYISLNDASKKMLGSSGCKDNYSIRRIISEQYGGVIIENNNDADNEITRLNGLNSLFEESRYILLLDGLNEVKQEASSYIYREIEELAVNKNIILVITSRFTVNNSFFASKDLLKFKLSGITSKVIESYLGEEVYSGLSGNCRLLEILSNPMLLSIYNSIITDANEAQVYAEQLIKPEHLATAGELLELYLKCHLFKYKRQQFSDRIDKKLKRILEVHLPQLAYGMYEYGTLTISEDEAEDILLRELDSELVKVNDVFDIGEEYNFIWLTNNYDETHIHMHQLLRDFFAAKHLKNKIENIIRKSVPAPHQLFNDIIHTKDIRQLLGEICHDYIHTPYLDIESNKWTMADLNNQKGEPLLNSLLSTCKNVTRPDMKYEVLNIVSTIALMRDNDLSGMDMSYLDLTSINLRNIRWSRNYISRYLSADFTGAIFNENNWLPRNTPTIMSVAVLDKNCDYFITGTRNGEIEVWNRNTGMCESTQKIVGTAIIYILVESSNLILLSDDNKVWSADIGKDQKPAGNCMLKYDLSDFPLICRLEVNKDISKKGDLVFYTYDKPTTRHYLDGSLEAKGQQDYFASSAVFNEKSQTWLRNTTFEGNIILEETSACRPVSNYKGHNNYNGYVVNSIKFNSLFDKFVTTTTNCEVFIWDCKSHQPDTKFFFPGKKIKGACFLKDGQILVYGDELFTVDNEGNINMFSSLADQNVLDIAPNSIHDGNYHHHIYALCQKSIKVLRIHNDELHCESVIDINPGSQIYRRHEIFFLSGGESGLIDVDTLSVVSYTKDSSEVRKYNLKACCSDSNDFNARYERFIAPDKVIQSKAYKYHGCFLRTIQNTVLFNDNASRRLNGQEKLPYDLKIQGCTFSKNVSLRLKEQFDKNCVLWEE